MKGTLLGSSFRTNPVTAGGPGHREDSAPSASSTGRLPNATLQPPVWMIDEANHWPSPYHPSDRTLPLGDSPESPAAGRQKRQTDGLFVGQKQSCPATYLSITHRVTPPCSENKTKQDKSKLLPIHNSAKAETTVRSNS